MATNITAGIKTKRYQRYEALMKRVVAYRDGVKVRLFDSITHASRFLKCSHTHIRRCIDTGTPIDGLMLYLATNDPNHVPVQEFQLDPADDVPVAIFDRESDEYIASYKSTTLFAKSLQRPLKTVVGWLNGERCTDPDFYYRRERDCTPDQLNHKFLK